jgi:hypothetical protein
MEMELQLVNQRNSAPEILNRNAGPVYDAEVIETSPIQPQAEKRKAFIEANTESVSLLHLKNECIIPVFRDNEKTVSHYGFVDAVNHCILKSFPRETVLVPEIRVSHKINGRIPSALNK